MHRVTGRVSLNAGCSVPAAFLTYLAANPTKGVEVVVRVAQSLRTSAQNRRYWALITVGADSLWGDRSEKERLHEEVAHLLLGLPACEKTGLRRRMRTPKLNTAEFARYTEDVSHKLVELGADLSEWDAEEQRMERAA